MKLEYSPILTCTKSEYETEIEPIIKNLDALDLCPKVNNKRKALWDCESFETCDDCPFNKANQKIMEAIKFLKRIEIKER